jgi:hypothetical protein
MLTCAVGSGFMDIRSKEGLTVVDILGSAATTSTEARTGTQARNAAHNVGRYTPNTPVAALVNLQRGEYSPVH